MKFNILILSMLLITFVWCSNNSKIENNLSDEKISISESINSWNLVDNLEDESVISSKRDDLDKIYIDLSSLTISEKSKLECDKVFSLHIDNSFINEYIKKCNKLKNDSIKELEIENNVNLIKQSELQLSKLLFDNLEKSKLDIIVWEYEFTIKNNSVVEDILINNIEKGIKIEYWNLPDWKYKLNINNNYLYFIN